MKKWIIFSVILVIAAGIGTKVLYQRQQTRITYLEETVTLADLTFSVSATGMAAPKSKVEIKPPISGRLESILVQEGQSVKKSQVLGWMSSIERAAVIDAARAKGPGELARWEEMYKSTPILSPISGTLIKRDIQEGQTVLNNEVMFILSDFLIIKAKVDETDVAHIKLRQPAVITLDAYPDSPFNGVVNRIDFDSTTENNVTTYGVEVKLLSVPSFLRSGMTANVTFNVSTKKQVPVIPSRFLQARGGKSYVLSYSDAKKKTTAQKEVQTGMSEGANTEITAGLNPGDVVLLETPKTSSKPKAKNPFSPFGRR